jgi:hypothetical protein
MKGFASFGMGKDPPYHALAPPGSFAFPRLWAFGTVITDWCNGRGVIFQE